MIKYKSLQLALQLLILTSRVGIKSAAGYKIKFGIFLRLVKLVHSFHYMEWNFPFKFNKAMPSKPKFDYLQKIPVTCPTLQEKKTKLSFKSEGRNGVLISAFTSMKNLFSISIYNNWFSSNRWKHPWKCLSKKTTNICISTNGTE